MPQIRHDILDNVAIAAVIGDDAQLYAIYARPNDDRPWTGDAYHATVTRYMAGQNAYFLDLDGTNIGLLPKRSGMTLRDGQDIIVAVERPAVGGKQARCSLIGDDTSTYPTKGRILSGPDTVAAAQKDHPAITDIQQGLSDYDTAILDLTKPYVELDNGISLMIEQTAALTAIDINSAGIKLKPHEVNYRAMTAIARQMRLRNLGGQIILDMLRLHDKKQQTDLDSYWKRLTRDDPSQIVTHGFTKMGLFEFTRVRQGLSLMDVFSLV